METKYESIFEVRNPIQASLALIKTCEFTTATNTEAVETHPEPAAMFDALEMLARFRILHQINFDIVCRHHELHRMVIALRALFEESLLTQEQFIMVSACAPHKLEDIILVLTELHKNHILSEDNIQILQVDTDPSLLKMIASLLKRLQEASVVVNQQNLDILTQPTLENMLKAISSLDAAGISTPQNISTISLLTQQNPYRLSFSYSWKLALELLQKAGILTQSNFDAFNERCTQHPSGLSQLAGVLQQLDFAHLLTQENFNTVIACSDLKALYEASSPLSHGHMLNKFTFAFISTQPMSDDLTKFITQYTKTHKQYLKIRSEANQAHADIPLELRGAFALLHDYTKGKVRPTSTSSPMSFFESIASKFKRGLTGHMNRHHVDAVTTILHDIQTGHITSRNELATRLNGIENTDHFNPQGSLAKRIAFLQTVAQIRQDNTQHQAGSSSNPQHRSP